MSKHTDGPWYWVGNSLESDRDYVLESNFTTRVGPNRCLIASSPELYELVGKLMRVIEAGIPDLEDVDEYQMAVALLNKIDGGVA